MLEKQTGAANVLMPLRWIQQLLKVPLAHDY
jgi:hypothetical protein